MSNARVTKGEGEEHPIKRRRTSCDEEVTIVSDQSTKSRNTSAPMKQKQYLLSCAPVGIPSPNPLNSNQRIPNVKYGPATRYAAQSSSTNGRITNSPIRSVDTCGKILKITLKDFMNHDKIDIDPGLHINILTGPNGAGKSSILQGIVLGLGKQ